MRLEAKQHTVIVIDSLGLGITWVLHITVLCVQGIPLLCTLPSLCLTLYTHAFVLVYVLMSMNMGLHISVHAHVSVCCMSKHSCVLYQYNYVHVCCTHRVRVCVRKGGNGPKIAV